ncbi:MAG: AGE family epimerase/isomerase [Niveispirillum sp.]|uniref:AGE family epimerase/isomerase n=1 Tax=Niveispirillum sp. TaxID=1917217 RepID=UPI004036F589
MTRSFACDQATLRRDRLVAWLVDHAYPLWSRKGHGPDGSFHEKLDQGTGHPVPGSRRARVQPRQVYAFSMAPSFGWTGPATDLVRRGLDAYLAQYRRPDGLFRASVTMDGRPLDDGPSLYDQAFTLFGLASAAPVLGDIARLHGVAVGLRDLLIAQCRYQGGFTELPQGTLPLQSNPNMHLFEAALAWEAAGGDTGWTRMADGIAELALSHFIGADTGALREFFDADWHPAPGMAGRIVEPGHQFEWAWLLLRWGRARRRDEAVQAGLRLLEIGERHGVDPARTVAFNSLLDDFSIHDHSARLWPQTERLKAAVLAAEITGQADFWTVASHAADGLLRYLDTPVPGLWWDKLSADGLFTDEPAPASSFYHIVCAVAEFDRAVRAAGK